MYHYLPPEIASCANLQTRDWLFAIKNFLKYIQHLICSFDWGQTTKSCEGLRTCTPPDAIGAEGTGRFKGTFGGGGGTWEYLWF